jgi:ubiquinone/menaquinone biosynthesis C-methylase UbiE
MTTAYESTVGATANVMPGVVASPDLAFIKQRQQATWASGDYHMIGTQILVVSELLIEALDLRSTERVLDVATGSGNAALAAARRGCAVVGLDYVPALLERARHRADAESLHAEFVEGDAESLPFDDGCFDVVSSVFGVMFAPDQDQAANELARVTRPGGRIGLVAHTPDGFIGQLFRTNSKHVPPPAGVRSPVLWGTED